MKITANILGPAKANFGLGNQMFQVATVLSYCKDYNFHCFFPDIANRKTHGTYIDNIFRNLDTKGCKESDWDSYKEPSFYYTQIPQFTRSTILQGYFQSYKYFEHNRKLILDAFRLSDKSIEYLLNKYGSHLNRNTLSLHIRRGDYLNLSHFHYPLTQTDYYQRALSMIDHDVLFVFSDDIQWCKDAFGGREDIIMVEEEDYLEMALMSMCKNNIIANSTFSWWGAWLNENENKKVIAPSNWFGQSSTYTSKDIVPQEWECI